MVWHKCPSLGERTGPTYQTTIGCFVHLSWKRVAPRVLPFPACTLRVDVRKFQSLARPSIHT